MVGSSFGVLLGLLLRQLLPAWWSIQPGVYAVVCATAMLGAVLRSSISLVAIMIEGTRGIGERRCWAVLC
jgi:chloride channel 7